MTTEQRLIAVVLSFVLIVGLLAGVIAAGAVAGEVGTTETERSPSPLSAEQALLDETEITADTTQMRANLQENGDADWELTYRQSLDSDADREGFEDLQTDIEADPDAYLEPFEERMEQLLETAQSTTDREMTMRNFSIETERVSQPQGEFGLVTFRFEWAGFAAESDGTIEAGDAIDQLILQNDEQLIITWPETFELDVVTPNPSVTDATQVRWEGPREFDAGQPRVTVTETGDEPPADGDDTGDDGNGEDALGSPLGPVLALLAVLGAAFAYGWYRRTGGSTADQPDAASENEQATAAANSAQPADSDLLSSEEQVLRIVNEHGGRVKQQVVTEELGWSAARTSQVVGNLRDEEEIESFRLGRENVLTLPEQSLAEPPESEEDN